MKTKRQGFTLIELLIVIAIIAIIAAVVFVALDPLTRFRDARDAARWTDVAAVLSAIKVDQVDNGGDYLAAISVIPTASSSEVFMITDGAVTAGCDDMNAYCDRPVTDDNNCVDLSELVTGEYLAAVPISPNGAGTWGTSSTGYVLEKKGRGILRISACESENATEITVAR